MEIGTKPIPISVLTAVTNSALNAASVFPSRRIKISDSHTDLNRSADISIFRLWTRLCNFVYQRRSDEDIRRRQRIRQFDGDIVRAYRGDTEGLRDYLNSDLPLSQDQREQIAELIYRRIQRKKSVVAPWLRSCSQSRARRREANSVPGAAGEIASVRRSRAQRQIG